jgi:hypothetical protein
MKNWFKRLEFFCYWNNNYEDYVPLINFSFDFWVLTTRPNLFNEINDTNRWKSIYFKLYISKYLITLMLPYKKISDHIPSKRQIDIRSTIPNRIK